MDDAALRSVRDVRDGAYWMAITVALTTGAVAVVCALALGLPIRDPDGFLGPTYVRLPLIAALMLAVDVLPRALYRAPSVRGVPASLVAVLRERWPWRRLRPPLIGLGAFYLTYVSYRNLKHYLPLLRPELVDRELLALDERMAGGQAPAEILHELLGTGVAAHVLSTAYVAFVVFLPVSLALALVFSRHLATSLFFATSLSLNWLIGAASYYLLPALGPIYADPGVFAGLPHTHVADLQAMLLEDRIAFLRDPDTAAPQHVAAFASLHIAMSFTALAAAHLLNLARRLKVALWTWLIVTTVATVYLGWHYLVDDIAGVLIGALSLALARLLTGYDAPARRRRRPGR